MSEPPQRHHDSQLTESLPVVETIFMVAVLVILALLIIAVVAAM